MFNDKTITALENIMTTLESAPAGPACLVTIGMGKKKFSTGFDILYWMENDINALVSIARLQKLLARVITLPMATLCVV